MPLITFQEALERTAGRKRHLLLGNGFSIALFPDRFRYASLLDTANFDAVPQAREAFEALATTDFEQVIQALRQSVILAPIYRINDEAFRLMGEHAEALKELLVQAVAGRHPERPSEISEGQYAACRAFLAHFAGASRNGARDLRGSIYTLNYDLLLYWTLLHNQVIRWNDADPLASSIEATEEIRHDDGFRAPLEEPDAPHVIWDGEANHSQCIFFLHGALHLFDRGYELQKVCWERSGGSPLVDQIRAALDDGRFPLFVSEGNTKGKIDRIRHSGYLHKGLRSFAANCNVQSCALFIFGHSLAENDEHILEHISRGKVPVIFISLFGAFDSEENRRMRERADWLSRQRPRGFPLEVAFFDAASADVWG